MTKLEDPAKSIITAIKPESTEKDIADNIKVKADAQKERLKVWKRPATKKERDDARAVRKADWELFR